MNNWTFFSVKTILTELLSDVAACAPDDDEHGAEHDAAEHDCRVAHHQLGLHQLILMICFLPPDHKASSFFCLKWPQIRCCIRDESFCCYQRSATSRMREKIYLWSQSVQHHAGESHERPSTLLRVKFSIRRGICNNAPSDISLSIVMIEHYQPNMWSLTLFLCRIQRL